MRAHDEAKTDISAERASQLAFDHLELVLQSMKARLWARPVICIALALTFSIGCRGLGCQVGTGSGLSIVQGLIQAHGGEIRLESVEHEGTTVTVILPAYRTIHAQPQLLRSA